MLRLLCSGDLHLGRHPTRVPQGDRGLSVERVWGGIVDHAVEQSVDALVLTGDIVDQENRFYESVGPLQRGLERLADAGVETYAVSGNHDYNVLPDLVDALDADQFHLLGRGGAWSRATIGRSGGEAAHLIGWSYRRRNQNASPIGEYGFREALPEDPEVPVVGLLHADLDQPESSYAPVTAAELGATPVDVWCLGHVHAPGEHSGAGMTALYPGSPQPLDPTETGPHGPWLLEIDGEGAVRMTMIPLATLRYEERDVDVSDVDDESDFRRRLTTAVRESLEQLEEGREQLEHVVYRLRCTGRTKRARDFDEFAARAVDELRVQSVGTEATVDAIDIDTRPAIDLERLLGGQDPPGELAQLLVKLRDGEEDPKLAELVDDTRQAFDDLAATNAYAPLRDPEFGVERPGEAETRRILYRQGIRLLEELLAQGEYQHGGEGDG